MAALAPNITNITHITHTTHIRIGAAWVGGSLWPEVAAQATAALQQRGLALRNAIVLVPYAALIEPVRAAFAAVPGWQPRVETVLTLAAALGPADELVPGQCSGDIALDRLQAGQWLAGLTDAAGAADIDRTHAAALLAEAATALVAEAALRAPVQRAAWQQALQSALASPSEGPGALEASLLRAAAAWAASAAAPATDRLFALEPAAWLVLRIGGADRLAEAVLEQSTCGGWLIDLDPPAEEPFAPWVGVAQPLLLCADDFESEAMAAAAEVLKALARSDGRVALVALDRLLVRRVAALLQRSGVELDDETGWKLSTTAAAGLVLARLRAASPLASGDDRLDWLKRWPPAAGRQQALRALETLWRAGRNARLGETERAAAQALWGDAERVLSAWQHTQQPQQPQQPQHAQSARDRCLADWLALLRQQLVDDGDWDRLTNDAAGTRLLQALQVEAGSAAWQAVLLRTRCDLAGFTAWFEALCESLTVQRPPRPSSRVVLTPLARAVGRPFEHVVLAGADAQRFGRDAGGPALIGDVLAGRLGLETAADRRQRQQLALAQLLRAPGLSVLWRRLEADAPVSPAVEVEWLQATWQQAGLHLPVQAVWPEWLAVAAQPVQRPLPTAATALPTALSASAVEALRLCPYRFFARSVLRLSESDEVDEPARKRDYGDWLHATLHRFHSTRQPGRHDASALRQAADEALQALALDPAAMLAYRASMTQLLPAYLAWLARHEAAGWQWQAGEDDLLAAPPDWAPQTLRGRLDRIDMASAGTRLVLDYKTGAATGLRARVNDPMEDTQLPYYVALLQAQGGGAEIEAAYLALDEADGPRLLRHPDVQHSAAVLVEQLAAELQRLRDGAPMPALGEGSSCDTCDARGLCRRDQWPPMETLMPAEP